MTCLVSVVGCVSIPPEVLLLHQKEADILQELRRTHHSLVDAYVDQKLSLFENWYFKEYGPVYMKNWKKNFKDQIGRDYDPDRDSSIFYNDLVAEYQVLVEPIEDIRKNLRGRVQTVHNQAGEAHSAVGRWLRSVRKLNASQREAFNQLLAAIDPKLSLNSVDKAVVEAKEKVIEKMKGRI